MVDSIGLIAQAGVGKTIMMFHPLETFRSSAHIAFLFQTHSNSREFMRVLLVELGCEEDAHDSVWMYCLLKIAVMSEIECGKRNSHRFAYWVWLDQTVKRLCPEKR